jgi:hypothetical protein
VTIVDPSRVGLGSQEAIGQRTATGTWIILGESEPGIAGSMVLNVTIPVDSIGLRFTAVYGRREQSVSGATVDTSDGQSAVPASKSKGSRL